MTVASVTTDPLSCRELVELVTDYLEERLSPAGGRRFEEHLEGCAGCSNYLDQMRTTIRLVGRVRETDLEPRARDALLEAFRDWKQ